VEKGEMHNIQVEDFWPPKESILERLIRNPRITPEILKLLAEQDLPPSETGIERQVEATDALEYIRSEIDFYHKYYPDGAIYKKEIELSRQRTKLLVLSLKKEDYKPLIEYCLDKSLKELAFSRRLAQNYAAMSETDRVLVENVHQEQISAAKKFAKTKNRDDLGTDPELFSASGKDQALRSRQLFAFAVCLAKATVPRVI
jgi:hypothetical protein